MNELIFLLSQNRYFYFKLRDRFYLSSVYSILIGRKDVKNSDWRANENVRPIPVLQVREVEEEHFAFDHERIVIPELY